MCNNGCCLLQIDPERQTESREGRRCMKMSQQVNPLTCSTFHEAHCWKCRCYLMNPSCVCPQCPQGSASRYWELWSVCRLNWPRRRSGPTVKSWGTWGRPCRVLCSPTSWPCSTPSNSSATRWGATNTSERPECSDHRWTAASSGVNVPKTHWRQIKHTFQIRWVGPHSELLWAACLVSADLSVPAAAAACEHTACLNRSSHRTRLH